MFKNAVRLISSGLRHFQAPCVLSRVIPPRAVVKHDAFSRVGESMRTFANQSTMNFQCKPKVQMACAKGEPWSSSLGPPLAINGFGRIGKMVLRLGLQAKINVVAINEPGAKIEDIAKSLKYDTVQGTFPGNVSVKNSSCLDIDGKTVKVYTEKDPEEIKWKELQVEYVIDSTRKFTEVEKAKKHMAAGVKKVIISAPSKDAPMFVRGVNFDKYKKDMNVVSYASRTTDCAAPLLNIINRQFGVNLCFLMSVQGLSSSQPVLDPGNNEGIFMFLKNITCRWTGAKKDVGIVIPELQGKMMSCSMRMPVKKMPLMLLGINVQKPVTVEELTCKKLWENNPTACLKEERGVYKIRRRKYEIEYGFPRVNVFGKNLIIINEWYASEMEYSKRLLDLYTHMIKVDNGSSIK